jgi:hypothetical protein
MVVAVVPVAHVCGQVSVCDSWVLALLIVLNCCASREGIWDV